MSETLEHGPRTGDNAPWRNKELLRDLYIDQMKSSYDIGEELGCSSRTILKWLKRYDIEIRDKYNASYLRRLKKPVTYRTDKRGYSYIQTKVGDKHYRVEVHRLVAVAEFGFDAVKDMQVHHKNGIRYDNRPENLELMTSQDHSSHHYNAEICDLKKVSPSECADMRDLDKNMTRDEIAGKFGFSTYTVSYHINQKCIH